MKNKKTVIVRTYSAGVFFGTLAEKQGNEVILKNARRLRQWFAREGMDLQGVATSGVVPEKSIITCPVSKQWIEAVEIISMTRTAIESIEGCKIAVPE